MNTTEPWVLVNDLLIRPYPDVGYHVVDLRVSGDFSDDETGEAAVAAWEQVDRDRVEVVAALTGRWGRPHRAAFAGPGRPVTALGRYLARFIDTVDLWHRDGRTVCLGVGQEDRKLPLRLVLTVSDEIG